LVHQFQIRNQESIKWYHVSVDVHNGDTILTLGQIVEVVDYVHKASYKVIQLPNKSPLDGFSVVVDPMDIVSSPLGWHSDKNNNYTTTRGNNVLNVKHRQM
jgi:extracellular elastinolytic metalloproteinase